MYTHKKQCLNINPIEGQYGVFKCYKQSTIPLFKCLNTALLYSSRHPKCKGHSGGCEMQMRRSIAFKNI